MGIKTSLIKSFASYTTRRTRKASMGATSIQQDLLSSLLKQAQGTTFGKEHFFADINNHADFAKAVPVRDYEAFKPFIQQIMDGHRDILWPGRPTFLAKTSGTTSGVKYIPMTRESTPFHVKSARDCLLNYFTETKNGSYFDGKMVYLSGSPLLTNDYGIKTGRLSGIVNHQIPRWLQSNKLPTYSANIIENWEEKVEAIVDETMNEDVRLVGGIPPWVQMYYERLLDRSGCSHVIDVFPNLSVFVYGGVNYEPYRSKLEDLVGAKVDTVETYPASEGFFAFQDKYPSLGLLLNVDAGMYFEFIPADEIFHDQPTRLSLEQVEIGVNYALLVSSNAGLWAYNIGDTVEFISLDPPRITVTGRIKHFISAFGEHVIGKEVEEAVRLASHAMHLQIIEFTVAPQVNPEVGLPYHEWLIEFNEVPADIARMEDMLDKSIQDQNIYYKDLIRGKVLRKAKITPVARNAFRKYMESIGKLGGQNKVARLSNDRSIANALEILHER